MITCVITNHGRPDLLWKAFQSAYFIGGFRSFVIASTDMTKEVAQVHQRIKGVAGQITALNLHGKACNAGWLAGVEAAPSEWVYILHDDDKVISGIASLAEPHLKDSAFVLFDASAHNSTGVLKAHRRICPLKEGSHPTVALKPQLLRDSHSLSPVIGIFPRSHLVSVLTEFEQNCASRPQFSIRPGMVAGNDLLIWLRATELPGQFRYIPKPLVSFNNHSGSTTYADIHSPNKKLPGIYNATKEYVKAAQTAAVVVRDRKKIAMRETSKAMRRRHCEEAAGGFKWSKVFTGTGVDVGAGNDPVQIPGCKPFDMADGDANHLSTHFRKGSLDYVHASQCLEHMHDPRAALLNWSVCVRKGGWLVVTVPSFTHYEKRVWPSPWNKDHKTAWSMEERAALNCKALVHIPTFVEEMSQHGLKGVLSRLVDTNYDYTSPANLDQTFPEDGAEAFYEMVFQKL